MATVRCTALTGSNTWITVGKDYEILPPEVAKLSAERWNFDIIDDDGDRLPCMWLNDPDGDWQATDYLNLLDCYRSGQMSERQWQGHLAADALFADWVKAFAS